MGSDSCWIRPRDSLVNGYVPVVPDSHEHDPEIISGAQYPRYCGTGELLRLLNALSIHEHGSWSTEWPEHYDGVFICDWFLMVVHSTCLFSAATVTGTIGSISSSMAWA